MGKRSDTMSSDMTTLTKVQKVFEKRYSLPPERVQPEAALESLGLDSLDAIEVLFDLEDEFDIRFPPDRRGTDGKITTIQDIINELDRLVAEQHPGQAVISTG
jgi:acyl carrier protein